MLCAGRRRVGDYLRLVTPILRIHTPLDFVWHTLDPFLFCVHHDDAYPRGNEQMGPVASLAGRDIGQDFAGKDGWRMYHGRVVPGFPAHPHRGFETVTVARCGYIDHSDSLGAAARFGMGDVQWMTAGKGVVHSEMFPLREREAGNPAELFQIWMNLPKSDKMVDPHFKMIWSEQVPVVKTVDEAGKATTVTVVAGAYAGHVPPRPPPHSWASRPDADVAIWTLVMEPGAKWTLPPAQAGSNRMLYVFRGQTVRIAGESVGIKTAVSLVADVAVAIECGPVAAELVLLQGRPIAEPVVQYGPFVMNTQAEIHQAYRDYQTTGFGGWPWGQSDPVHPREEGRFARHADGRVERGG